VPRSMDRSLEKNPRRLLNMGWGEIGRRWRKSALA
jgi:hypothetical protein